MSHLLPDPEPTPLAHRLVRHPERHRQGLPPTAPQPEGPESDSPRENP